MRTVNISRFFLIFFFCFIAFGTSKEGVCSASELQKNVQKSNSATLIQIQDVLQTPSVSVRPAPSAPLSPISNEFPRWKTDDFKNRCQRIFNAYGSLDIFFEILGYRMENEELRWAYMFILAYREQKNSDAQVEFFRFNSHTDFDTCFNAYLLRREERESPNFKEGDLSEDLNTNIAESRINWINGWLKFIKPPKNTLKEKVMIYKKSKDIQ